jgi:fatty-acyl-CoA synthase
MGEDELLAETTIGAMLLATAERAPDALALVDATDASRRWTWAELTAEATDTARRIAAQCNPGDVCAIWARSNPSWVILELACALAGVVVQPIDPDLDLAAGEAALRRTGARALFVDAHDEQLAHASMGMRADLPALGSVAMLGEVIDAPASATLPAVDPGMGAVVLPTSGTTGEPKGALLSHRAVTADARLVAHRMGLRADDLWLTAMPLHRSGGCVTTVVACVATGAAMVCATTWAPLDVLYLVRRDRATVLSAFPRALHALVDEFDGVDRPRTTLRLVQTGGAPVSSELVRTVGARLGARMSVVYGLTEASPVLTQTDQCDPADDPAASVGRALPGTQIAVVDPRTGDTLPTAEVGEIVARGPQVMDGYVGNVAATARAIDQSGWLHTGDMGWLDHDGRLHVEGRLDDLIERAGTRWLPGPVERALVGVGGVADAVVVGIAGDGHGEAVAFIRLEADATHNVDELRAAVFSAVGARCVPDRFVVLDELPALPSGKVRRFVLRNLASEAAVQNV